MLINMRSGLYDYINASSDFFPQEIANKIEKQEYNNQPVEENIVVDYLNQTQTLTTPDTTFFYCNTDYYLLAKILEQVSGMSYKDYMKKYIFSPCGMTHTNCNFQNTTAKGYDYKNHYYSFPEDFAIGCGDVNSNVIDLLKWNLQLSEGKVIKKKSYKKIISEKNYSYGLIKNSNSVLHAGNTCVFNSYNVFNHKTKTSINDAFGALPVLNDASTIRDKCFLPIARALPINSVSSSKRKYASGVSRFTKPKSWGKPSL